MKKGNLKQISNWPKHCFKNIKQDKRILEDKGSWDRKLYPKKQFFNTYIYTSIYKNGQQTDI